jgi:hypothetical protein
MIIPLCPPDVEKGKRKTRELAGVKVDSSRIRNSIQEMTIMDVIRDNFPWLDKMRKIKTNRQLAKPQPTSTY